MPKTRVPVLADPYRDRLLARLKRVEGQVRGIQKMVDEGRYCVEILEQLAAANQALRATAQDVLRNYLRTCATNAIRSGSDAEAERVYGELTENFFKFAR